MLMNSGLQSMKYAPLSSFPHGNCPSTVDHLDPQAVRLGLDGGDGDLEGGAADVEPDGRKRYGMPQNAASFLTLRSLHRTIIKSRDSQNPIQGCFY